MKILCTGSKGFVASYVKKLYPNAIGYDIKEVSEDNILNEQHLFSVLKKHKIDTVIHLAASISVTDSEKHPQTYIQNNIEGTLNVITASIRAGVKKIIYASSSACLEPTSSIYALTKYTPELLLKHYKDQIETISLRFFNIYGKGSNPIYGRVIDEFIRGIRENGEITIYGDGKQTRDFIHAKDAARAIKLAVEKKLVSGGEIDIGTGKAISVNKLVDIIGVLMDEGFKINYAPARKEARYSQASVTKARRFLSFKPEIDLKEGLKELL